MFSYKKNVNVRIKKFFVNSKGQFFSQDLVVAGIIFVFSIMLFMIASQSVYLQVNLIESRNHFDGAAHTILESLVEHPGYPVGWEKMDFGDVNSFGIVKQKNVIEKDKIEKIMDYLENEYDLTRIKLGAGAFDLNLMLVDAEGNIIYSSGREIQNPLTKLIYEKIVFFNDELAILKGVITVG